MKKIKLKDRIFETTKRINFKKHFKRVISGLVISSVMATSVIDVLPKNISNTITAFASTQDDVIITQISATQRLYDYGDYTVNYKYSFNWDKTQHSVTLKITNTSGETIENWGLLYDFGGDVSSMWGSGQLMYSDDDTPYLKSPANNANITPGSSATINYTLSNITSDFPDSFKFIQKRITRSQEDFTASLSITSQSGSIIYGIITINNMSDTPVEAYELDFACNFTVTTSNSAECSFISTPVGYKLKGSYGKVIQAGQNVQLSFSGTFAGAGTPSISDCSLSGVVVDFGLLDNDDDKSSRESYIKYVETYEDLIFEGVEFGYVKNQIVMNAIDDVPFEQIENIISEYNGEIVGYLASTNHFQIEFNEDKTKEFLVSTSESLVDDIVFEYGCLNTFSSDTPNSITEFLPNDYNSIEENPWESEKTWGLRAINAPAAWAYRDFMQPVKIGVIDTMFDGHYEGQGEDKVWINEHEDLTFKYVFNNPETLTQESPTNSSHGTHVAGTIAATFDNGIGISGIVPNATLYGFSTHEVDSITPAKFRPYMHRAYIIETLVDKDVRVINISMSYFQKELTIPIQTNKDYVTNINTLTGEKNRYTPSNAAIYLQERSNEMVNYILNLKKSKDFLIVNSAGNNGKIKVLEINGEIIHTKSVDDVLCRYINEEFVPLTDYEKAHLVTIGIETQYNDALVFSKNQDIMDMVMSVGLMTYNDGQNNYNNPDEFIVSPYSNFGDRVDVIAPGHNIYSTVPLKTNNTNTNYDMSGGTSMSAPHVSGIAGLIYSINPDLTAKDVKEIITRVTDNSRMITHTATDGNEYSYKVADAYEAVLLALETLETGNFSVNVSDIDNNTPIGGIQVVVTKNSSMQPLTSQSLTLITNANGVAQVRLPVGDYAVEISSEKYETESFSLEILLDSDNNQDVKLTRKTAPVSISVISRARYDVIPDFSQNDYEIPKVVLQNIETGQKETFELDENGCADAILPVGEYSVCVLGISQLGYSNTFFTETFSVKNYETNIWKLKVNKFDNTNVDFRFGVSFEIKEDNSPLVSDENIDLLPFLHVGYLGGDLGNIEEIEDNRIVFTLNDFELDYFSNRFYAGFDLSKIDKSQIENKTIIVTMDICQFGEEDGEILVDKTSFISFEVLANDLISMFENGDNLANLLSVDFSNEEVNFDYFTICRNINEIKMYLSENKVSLSTSEIEEMFELEFSGEIPDNILNGSILQMALYGDVNGDKVFDIRDILEAKKMYLDIFNVEMLYNYVYGDKYLNTELSYIINLKKILLGIGWIESDEIAA